MTGDRHAEVLLTSRQQTSTTVLLTDAAIRRGMDVRPLVGDPQELAELARSRSVHWYGGRSPPTGSPADSVSGCWNRPTTGWYGCRRSSADGESS